MTYNRDRKEEIIALLSTESDLSFTAEQICEKVLGSGGGKSTVYRIISSLVEEGVLKRISDGKSRHVKYQYLGEKLCSEHLHLKCRSCGRLIHLNKTASESIISSLESSEGFLIDCTEILSGSCTKCALAKR